jgi:hypothetical protein
VRARIATAVVVALAFAASAVTAAPAGNPHGVPPGQQEASGLAAPAASVKPSSGAQAHAKAQPTTTAAHATVKTHGHAASSAKVTTHGGGATHSTVHTAVPASTTVQAQTSVSAGVKPSSQTSHNTLAPASSNQTKLYGNGQTAGQIATRAGFGSAMLHGPGNSQPHKAICGPHNVDVHALKAHAAACTTSVSGPAVTPSVSPSASAPASVSGSAAGQAPSVAANSAVAAKGAAQSKPSSHRGGVLGAKVELASVTKPVKRAILATVRKGGTLPFTGLALWLPMALGLALIASGYGLRRKAVARP